MISLPPPLRLLASPPPPIEDELTLPPPVIPLPSHIQTQVNIAQLGANLNTLSLNPQTKG